MGLSSSLYTGVSGLKGHGEKMGTIGNNISNVSTVGFKGSRMHFEDFMSQDINTGAGVGQVGRGVGVGAVMNDFSQGSLESTNEATDVAIGGDGFFQVSARGTDENLYTRAGNFRFDEEGYLVDPNNNVVQGWEVREDPPGVADDDEIIQTETGVEIQGAPGDIRLDDFQSPPEQTRKVDKMVNLDSRSEARSSNASTPLTGDDELGTEANLQINNDYLTAVLSEDDPADPWLLEDEDGTVIRIGLDDGDISFDPDDPNNPPDGDPYELRWNEDLEDFALYDGGWREPIGIDPPDINGGDDLDIDFDEAAVNLQRGGNFDAELVIDGADNIDINFDFDSADHLVRQLNGEDYINADYDSENNTLNISVENEDDDGNNIDELSFEFQNLSSKTASELGVTSYKEGQPFSAMWHNWDATNDDDPISDNRYAYQSTMKVYDENGTSYELTNYFDPVEIDDPSGNKHWEFMTTVNPEHDNREGMEDSEKRGVLMTGALTFNPGGELIDQSAYTLGTEVYDDDTGEPIAGGDFASDLSNWSLSDFSDNGYPVFTPNFLGIEGQNFTGAEGAQNIEMNFGLRNQTGNWEAGSAESPAELTEFGNTDFNFDNIAEFEETRREAQASTQYSSSSTTLMQNQDGYTTGFLQNIEIDRNGVLTGRYDNGQVMDLYALTLADFHNEQGLRKEGGNLFSETRSSGPAMTGLAGTRGLGEISSNSLEMSNVDLATEFVKLIQTEKGFQANSKTIQTTDTMLGIIMQMKR